MKPSTNLIFLVFIVLGLTLPVVLAIYFHSGWYLLGWILISSVEIKDTGNEQK